MSTLNIEPLSGEFNYTAKRNRKFHNNNIPQHVLKSKENIYKIKCNKVLKRKLKKYKLRKDGQEDQDVIDISENLQNQLKINCLYTSENHQLDIDDFKPVNYLTKMVKKKQTTLKDSNTANSTNIISITPKKCTITEVILMEKQKTANAFQVMMDSRNKSIGGNSPGKDAEVDETELLTITEKKEIKAKRNLTLQKMAEAKGSLKIKENEELKEKFIKRKMEKRAQHLKNMIMSNAKSTKTVTESNSSKIEKAPIADECKSERNTTKKMRLVNLFNEPELVIKEGKRANKLVSEEDEEFLKKLSPSLKKKENMLSYFSKLEKAPDLPFDMEDSILDNVIKVKISTKKNAKKKKLSLKKCLNMNTLDSDVNSELKSELEPENNTDFGKKKKIQPLASSGSVESTSNMIEANKNAVEDNRPRRSVKRPIKYIDDVALASSDDELHIFTPKKKKKEVSSRAKACKSTPIKFELTNGESNDKANNKKSKSGVKKCAENKLTKPVKLAPIFAVKPQLDSAQIEARQKFLHSGIPEKLKKIASTQKSISQNLSLFPIVSHIQQNSETTFKKNPKTIYKLLHSYSEECTVANSGEFSMKDFLVFSDKDPNTTINPTKVQIKTMLESLKINFPKFPVYRTYRLLKSKKNGEFKDHSFAFLDNSIEVINGLNTDLTSENPDKLNWTEKYKAVSSNQIIGNFESVKEIKRWLVTWTENDLNLKKKAKAGSDSSDFDDTDPDSRDSMKSSTNNVLILNGPSGCGKTSCIYAIAAELSMKVIEVNASSKRTGKIMLQDLQEATQSHKVNRGKGSSTENSQKSQESIEIDIPKIKKKGRPKKKQTELNKKPQLKNDVHISSSQEPERTVMSLILVDDADIVFDQDDGFSAAVAQLVQFSKRPVVLVTSYLSCPHLQRFVSCGKVVNLHSLIPRMLGTWLDIMCLVDSGVCWPGSGSKLLDFFRGDIRKTINHLQFLMTSQITSNEDEIDSQSYKVNLDDENSSMSWADYDPEDKNISQNSKKLCIWKHLMRNHSQLLHTSYQLDYFNTWWSLPSLLDLANINDDTDKRKAKDTQKQIKELNAIAHTMDDFSIVDYYQIKPDTRPNITSEPWYSSEYDSVSEQNNKEAYSKSYGLMDEISSSLLTKSVIEAQKKRGCENKSDIYFPDMTANRKRDRTIARHSKLTDHLNPSAVFDRKALALDYWPSCRTICRIEKDKTDCNSKRNNRFCHYLKTLNIQCKNEYFDQLSKGLCSSEDNAL